MQLESTQIALVAIFEHKFYSDYGTSEDDLISLSHHKKYTDNKLYHAAAAAADGVRKLKATPIYRIIFYTNIPLYLYMYMCR